ncbi:hypothetical protein [Chitinophaga sp. CF418]|nr:hypothetical protein [Chitinophaga sp. CF418]
MVENQVFIFNFKIIGYAIVIDERKGAAMFGNYFNCCGVLTPGYAG